MGVVSHPGPVDLAEGPPADPMVGRPEPDTASDPNTSKYKLSSDLWKRPRSSSSTIGEEPVRNGLDTIRRRDLTHNTSVITVM